MTTVVPRRIQFPGLDSLYVKYAFNFGASWKVMQGVDCGISQIARKGTDGDTTVVWNFPLDITFKSVSAHGWPRLVLSVSRLQHFGLPGCNAIYLSPTIIDNPRNRCTGSTHSAETSSVATAPCTSQPTPEDTCAMCACSGPSRRPRCRPR